MSGSITTETTGLSGGMTSTQTEHAHVSTDGKGHGKITVRAGVGATSATDSRTTTYSEEPRPQWLPANFKTPQALVESQREGQATITRLSQELAAQRAGAPSTAPSTSVASQLAPTPMPPAPVADLTRIAAAALVPTTLVPATETTSSVSTPASAPPSQPAPSTPADPVDLTALSAEWGRNGGKLSAASLARLEKQGISQATVNQYIEAQEALAAKHTASLERVAGGKDRLALVLNWAMANSHPATNRYNMALATGDYEGASLFLASMTSGYVDEVGRNPRLAISGIEATRMEAEQPFLSMAEMVKAQDDRRYGKDPAYTRMVERRGLAYAALKRAGKAF